MKLWIAQGFGVGRIPFAPGTFGSLLGLGWFALLLLTASWWIFGAGVAAGFALSVWLCGEGAIRLGQKDPGSVILDEITAMPLCFASLMAVARTRHNHGPGPDYFFSAAHSVETAVVFLLFRVFDILKPWPVRQSQSLYGGLGITIDDFLAAGYVNLVVWVISRFVPGLKPVAYLNGMD